MSEQPITKTEDNRARRLEAARQRVAFWSLWGAEVETKEVRAYCEKRLNYWRRESQHIEMEA